MVVLGGRRHRYRWLPAGTVEFPVMTIGTPAAATRQPLNITGICCRWARNWL